MTGKETSLRDDARRWVEEVKHADLIVGIPSYKNEGTIGFVVATITQGLQQYFPDRKCAIINSDGGSPDQTRDVVRKAKVDPSIPVLSTEYQGIPGKGSAFRALFEIVGALDATACVVVDSDLRSITAEWIDRLAGPVVRGGYDFVAPLYTRHKHDGTITNNIIYPMTRMLYGLNVRQPIGGDFGFSAKLVEWWLQQEVWSSDVARYGIDIWMTTTAIAEGFKVCQAQLGPKIHDAKDPAASLGPMFAQVVGTLFGLMKRYEAKWQMVDRVNDVPTFGQASGGEPEPVPVTVSAMIDKFRSGVETHARTLADVLSAENMVTIKDIVSKDAHPYIFPADQWGRIVFDFALAYQRQTVPADALIAAMVPLYYGRTAGLVREAAEMDSRAFERDLIQAQATVFERMKPDLVSRWKSSNARNS